MLFLYLFFIRSLYNYNEPGIYNFTLYAGQYTVSCYGAQGGDRCDDGNPSTVGGKGARTKGIMTITGKGTKFYAFVGGRGGMCEKGYNKGGFNGGGDSGKDTGKLDARPGAGGGATDLRINDDSIKSRIMVAGGGSGGAWNCQGAYGGDTKIICPGGKNNEFREDDDIFGVDGNGGGGRENDVEPGSGGGGGYIGGRGGQYCTVWGSSYKAVGCGGSSYISSDSSAEPHEKMRFQSPKVTVNDHEGNGMFVVEIDFVCENGCASCKSESVCVECFEGFLFEGKCGSSCPEGYFEKEHSCVKCDEKCKTCQSSSSNCLSCVDGFHLHDNECVDNCPPGTTTTNELECLPCKTPCKECSSTPTECSSCIDNYNLYNNECVSKCPEGSFESNFVCEKCDQDSHCKTCSSSKSCTSCGDGFFLYDNKCVNKCPEKMFGRKNVCVECKSPCNNCESENVCKSCIDKYYLYKGKCYPVCPDGTSISDANCVEDQL